MDERNPGKALGMSAWVINGQTVPSPRSFVVCFGPKADMTHCGAPKGLASIPVARLPQYLLSSLLPCIADAGLLGRRRDEQDHAGRRRWLIPKLRNLDSCYPMLCG